MRSRRTGHGPFWGTVRILVGALVVVWSLAPIYWATVIAFATPADIRRSPGCAAPAGHQPRQLRPPARAGLRDRRRLRLGARQLRRAGARHDGPHPRDRAAGRLRLRTPALRGLEGPAGRDHRDARGAGLPRAHPAVPARHGDRADQHPAGGRAGADLRGAAARDLDPPQPHRDAPRGPRVGSPPRRRGHLPGAERASWAPSSRRGSSPPRS